MIKIYYNFLFKIAFSIIVSLNLSIANNLDNQDSLSIYYLKLKNIQKENALLLIPDEFNETINSFKKAFKALSENDTSAYKYHFHNIKKNIITIEEFLNSTGDIFNKTFINRKHAFLNKGNKYAVISWNKGEYFLKKASSELKNKKVKNAKKYATNAAEYYKISEIQALKKKYLSSATNVINEAKALDADQWAPISYNNAISYLKKAANLISNEIPDINEIEKYALLSENEAIAAKQYSVLLSAFSNKPHNAEVLLINERKRLLLYADLLNLKQDTVQNIDVLSNEVFLKIENLINERKMLFSEIESLENELTFIKNKLDSCLQIDKKEEDFKRKTAYIKTLFKDEKANVSVTDINIIINLYGIKFVSDNSVIPPEYFEILNKVVQSISEFKKYPILIIGHTDSRGNAKKNKNISEKQAAAVMNFIQQNSDSHNNIQTIGMGENKPIASNGTAKGRQLNRRIEIVINLEK